MTALDHSVKALVLPALKLLYESQRTDDALAMFDELLARDLPRETRCAVLAYRSMACAQAGHLDHELRDLEAAHALSDPDSFRRYGIELGLAMNAGKRGDAEARARWTERAEATLAAVPLHERETDD